MTRTLFEHAVHPLSLIAGYAILCWAVDRFGGRLGPRPLAADSPGPVRWWGAPLLMLYLVGLMYGLALLPEVVR